MLNQPQPTPNIDWALAEMVNAFLRWPLPITVCSDACVTRQGKGRIGTNLLTCPETVGLVKEVFEPIIQRLLKEELTTAQAELAEAKAEVAHAHGDHSLTKVKLDDQLKDNAVLKEQRDKLRARVAEMDNDKRILADFAEEVLQSYIIGKRVEAGHPCPENLVICVNLRAAIDAAKGQPKVSGS